MMNSICDDCMNRRTCIIDSSANIQRCFMYASESKCIAEIIDKFSEQIADKVIEKMKTAQAKETQHGRVD